MRSLAACPRNRQQQFDAIPLRWRFCTPGGTVSDAARLGVRAWMRDAVGMAPGSLLSPHRRAAPALESLAHHFAPIADAAQEIAIFAFLDPKWRLLGLRYVSNGAVDALTLSLRDVIADVITFDAVAVAMAHNHPSGDPTPSAADYVLTRRLAQTLDAIGVLLVDHVVLARGGRASFRERGLL